LPRWNAPLRRAFPGKRSNNGSPEEQGAGVHKEGRFDSALWQRSLRAAASPERGNANGTSKILKSILELRTLCAMATALARCGAERPHREGAIKAPLLVHALHALHAEKEKGKGIKIKGLRGGVSVLIQANRR